MWMQQFKKLVETSLLSGLSTFTKLLGGLVIIKIMAVILGPNGVALYGQFMSFISIIAVVAGGGISYGIIKYVAEYANEPEQLRHFLGNASLFTLIFSSITLLFGIVFNHAISQWILGSTEYAHLITLLAVVQFFIALNVVINSVLNGLKKIRLLTVTTIIATILSLALIITLLMRYGIQGALISLILSQLVFCVVAFLFIYKDHWLRYLLNFKFHKQTIINLLRFSVMNVIGIIVLPSAQIIVRNDLNALFSWHTVGYWQAVLKLSDAYILMITTTLTAYYLPRLSEIKDIKLIKWEMLQAYKTILPAIFLMLLATYFLRDWVLKVLYSEEFLPASNLFLYQLLGDFFRVAGWLSTYLLLAKLWVKTYVITEVVLSVLFIVVSHVMVRSYGLIGVTYGFASTYFIYWLLMLGSTVLYFKREKKLCLA